MKIEEKHFTFNIKWVEVVDKETSLKKIKEFLIGIGWLESEKDRSYVNLFSYHVNGDLSIEIIIDDNQRNPCQNADWAEDLFDALRKEEDVLQVSLLRNEASKEMILEYMLDAPFNNQDTTSFFVIYHKGVKRE